MQYIELIYDLIFVYLLGRNNSLLGTLEDGVIPASVYVTYLVSSLIILEVWYFTVLFINRYGKGGAAEYIAIFINMYLLYYMADANRTDVASYFYRYNIAWALILVNIGVMYLIGMLRAGELSQELKRHMKYNMTSLFVQAGCVLVSLPVFAYTGLNIAPAALIVGLVLSVIGSAGGLAPAVDFPYLAERVMLYVVFSFGEMIISLAGYFAGAVTLRSIYFSLMGFLIVVGLFIIYGYYYDHLIDHELRTTGIAYMLLHIVLITAMNHITVGLELMHEEHADTFFKTMMITISFIVYFGSLFVLMRFARKCLRPDREYAAVFWAMSLMFALAMIVFHLYPVINIAITVTFIYGMLYFTARFTKKHEKSQ